MRFTESELELIRSAFKDNEELLKVMRKVFLPEIDPKAPLGQTIDLWMTIDVKGQDPLLAYQNLLARNMLITHVDQQLIQLQFLAGMETKSPLQLEEERKKDSTK